MTSKERIDAVLARSSPDRPPFSFWHHFPALSAGPAAVEAHIDQLNRYRMDFLKVMNDNPYPHFGRIESVEELTSLRTLRGDEEGFGDQLELIAFLKAAVGKEVYLPTTIFNTWSILRLLVQPPTAHLPPNLDAAADAPSRWLKQAYAERPDLVAAALQTIGQNLARFATKCLDAGADGIFLSVRDDWVDAPSEPDLYGRLVRPTDLVILEAASSAHFNILHVCGKAVNFRAFADYPVPAINWADRAAGPSIAEVAPWAKPALCAGIDNLGTLLTGTPDQVRQQALDAIRQAAGRPLILTPGCTFDPARVSPANLEALAAAVQTGG